jgi:hypothetical protein
MITNIRTTNEAAKTSFPKYGTGFVRLTPLSAGMATRSIRLDYFIQLAGESEEVFSSLIELFSTEYQNYSKLLSAAIIGLEEKTLRQVKHKLVYSLHLIGLEAITTYLDELSMQMGNLPRVDREAHAKGIVAAFEEIIDHINDQADAFLSIRVTGSDVAPA